MSTQAVASRPAKRKLSDAQQLRQLSVALLCSAESMDRTQQGYTEASQDFHQKMYRERAFAIAEIIVRQQKRRFAKIEREAAR